MENPTFTPRAPETETELRVHSALARGLLIAEIARLENMTRQAMWEFCGRRGWLPGEEQGRFAQNIAEKDRRARSRKRSDAK